MCVNQMERLKMNAFKFYYDVDGVQKHTIYITKAVHHYDLPRRKRKMALQLIDKGFINSLDQITFIERLR